MNTHKVLNNAIKGYMYTENATIIDEENPDEPVKIGYVFSSRNQDTADFQQSNIEGITLSNWKIRNHMFLSSFSDINEIEYDEAVLNNTVNKL